MNECEEAKTNINVSLLFFKIDNNYEKYFAEKFGESSTECLHIPHGYTLSSKLCTLSLELP